MEFPYEIIAYIASFTEDAINLKLLNKGICDEIIKEENTYGWKQKYINKMSELTAIPPIKDSINWKLEYHRILKGKYFSVFNKLLFSKNKCIVGGRKGPQRAIFIPKELGNIICLEILKLVGYGINYLPKELSKLINLVELNFEFNNIVDIPKELYSLSNLRYLNFEDNRIEKILPEIENMVELCKLKLNGNLIKILPKELGNLKKLEHLNISYNNIKNLPLELSNLKNLVKLYINNNEIEYLSIEICSIESLKRMCICNNKIIDLSNLSLKIENNKDFLLKWDEYRQSRRIYDEGPHHFQASHLKWI